MFIIAQIPFVDFRLVAKKTDAGCFFPNIFDDNFERVRYYRFLGEGAPRSKPDELPPAERNFFNARKAVHLNPDIFFENGFCIPRLVFSRFFADMHSFHFDIGIKEMCKGDVSQRDLHKFIENFMQTPLFGINRNFEKEEKHYSLLGLARKIKEIYLYATTSKKKQPKQNYASQIVLGYPSIFLIYDKKEVHSFGEARAVHLENGIKVRHELVPVKNTLVDVWYIGRDGASKRSPELRNLRIYLSKLHAHKEATRVLLDYVNKYGNEGLDLHKLGLFLGYMLKQMGRGQNYGYNNRDFWEAAFYIDNKYNHASWDDYKMRIEAKLKEIEMTTGNTYHSEITVKGDNHGTITGQVIMEGKEGDFKDHIQEFEKMVQELVQENSRLTDEQKGVLKEQAETFETYVKGAAPERGFAQKLLDNIKNTFSLVIANPDAVQALIETGKKIIGLFR